MVRHDIRVRGVDMQGVDQKRPVILQMRDDDFPKRFLQDLASPEQPPISTTTVVDLTTSRSLFQPVQRMLHLALVKLSCNTLGYPRVNPTRVESAGLVIRRVYRRPGNGNGTPIDDSSTLSGWMRSASGQLGWVILGPDQENLDPDPLKRPQLTSGQAELDRQLAASTLASANTESFTPAFVAPPATCASLNRTVLYALIPTASSEVSDTLPITPPQFDGPGLINSLPNLLLSGSRTPSAVAPTPNLTINYRWLSDDFLYSIYPPTADISSNPPPLDPNVRPIQLFATALRMLHTVFGAFDPTEKGAPYLTF